MNDNPKNDAGRQQPARRHTIRSNIMVARPVTAAKRARTWLDDVVRDADYRWHDRHLLPLAVLALEALHQ